MENCPTCGRPIVKDEAARLLAVLTAGHPHREVYHARDGGWFVTYGGGQFSAEAVQTLIQRGAIASVYSNCPKDAYHVGLTIDMEVTMAARKAKGKSAPIYYLQQTPGA